MGLRDRAIILTLTLIGRRRAEVLNMTAGDLTHEDGRIWYRYRGKGNKQGKREPPEPAYVAITAALPAFGQDIGDDVLGCVVVAVRPREQGPPTMVALTPTRLPPTSTPVPPSPTPVAIAPPSIP